MNPAGYLEQIETLRQHVKNLQAAIKEDNFFAGQARIRIRNAIVRRLDDTMNSLYEIDVELANLFESPADELKYQQ